MKHFAWIAACCACMGWIPIQTQAQEGLSQPDSIYLFSYATTPDEGRSGLKFAWSRDGEEWFSIGNERGYVKCDYGAWGAEKRMIKPELRRDAQGVWHCIWQLNGNGKEFGHAASADLLNWKRQSYFTDAQYKEYISDAWSKYPQQTAKINNTPEEGTLQKVAWYDVERLQRFAESCEYRNQLYNEQTDQDKTRFADLKPVNLELTVQPEKEKAISDKLIGVFFEDINYGADGGLYAELVQNRDFEYVAGENHRVKEWGPTYAWSLKGEGAEMSIQTSSPIHPNNSHYLSLKVNQAGAELSNTGFDGMVIKEGEKYDFSFFARTAGKSGKAKISLYSPDGSVLANKTVSISSKDWKKVSTTLQAKASADAATLGISLLREGEYDLDMVSLFPQNTFKGHKNGLRPDLAQAIADIRPRFVRFPGGCASHGQGLENIYRWKNTVGPLETRKPMKNIWGYHQTMGIGYFEYFQFCEDIGAEPLPVIAAGVPCQNSACIPGKLLSGGQQGGIPMEEMDAYIQDILDLIDYANGDPKKSQWAKLRAESGHPKPFNLKYIGIGNEDLITDVFEERFTLIYDAIKKHHPEITVIGTVGPFYEGTDYEEGWNLADRLNVPMVDEHYYNTPGWFIYNQNYYDKYDRSKSKVYLGEYAAHLPGRPNNIETALAEALYLTTVERNGDMVLMTSYAPLLAKEGYTQWNPDLIYFNNKEVKPSVGYYTQLLYGQNSGDRYLPAESKIDNNRNDVRSRIASSIVRDSPTGDLIIKLVNLLPAAVNSQLNLPADAKDKQAKVTVLSGDPDDQNAKPVEKALEASDKLSYTLPPYSFSVIRFSAKE